MYLNYFFKPLIALIFIFVFVPSYGQTCNHCSSSDPINNGLIACYPFNGNTDDESGNNYHGTPYSITYSANRFGRTGAAGSFNGTTSSVDITNTIFQQSQYTYSVWMKVPFLTSSVVSAISVGTVITDQALLFYNVSSAAVSYNSDATTVPGVSSTPPTSNTWHHYVMVRSSTTLSLYRNGVLVSSGSVSGKSPGYGSAGYGALIGARVGTVPQRFNGYLDDVRIYNRALSAAEVLALYNLPDDGSPTVNAGSDKTICLGDSVQLTILSTSGSTYSWSPTTGLSNPNIANPYAKPTDTSKYYITVSNGTCSATDSVTVNVNTNCCGSCIPTIPINSGLLACYPFTGNVNDETKRTGNGTNNGATLTTDRFNNANRAYAFNGSKSISTPAIGLTNNTYTYSAWIKLTSLPTNGNAYTILGIGGNVTGDQVMMVTNNYSGGQTGFTATSYRTPVNPTGPDKYSTGVLPTINTWYHVAMVRDAATNRLKLYVNGAKLGDVPITATTAAYDLPGQGLIGARAPGNIQYFNGSIDDVRIYNRALTDNDVSILFNIPNQSIFSPNAGLDKTLCLGDSVQLAATGGTTYLWTAPTTGLSQTTIANPYAKPTDSIQYYVTISNNLCSVVDTVNVNVNKITVSAGTDKTICFRDSVQLLATASAGATFSWTPTTSLSSVNIYNPYAKPSDTTTYKVTATLNGCSAKDSVVVNIRKVQADAGPNNTICLGDSIQLQASGGSSYAWNQNSTLSDTTLANPYAKPTTTTKYIVNVSDGTCRNWDSVTISITSVILNAGLDTSMCLGDSVRLGATGATSYAWKTNPTLSDTAVANPYAKPSDTTMYYVIGKIGACSVVDSVKVNIKKTTVSAGTDKTICFRDSVQLIATSGAGATFSWTPTTSLSSTNIYNPYAKPSDTTTYKVTATLNGCSAKDTVVVNIRKVPADAGPSNTICPGDSIRLQASGGGSYAWNQNSTLSDTTLANPYAKPTTTTKYIVNVSDGVCSNWDSVTINIGTLVVNAGMDTSICLGDSARLQATAISGSTFSWVQNSTLSNPGISNPYAKPSTTTTYTVTATLNGCSASDSVKVNIKKVDVTASLDQNLCFNDSIRLQASASPGSSLSWTPASSLSNPVVNNPYAKPGNTTTYTVTATLNGCTAADSTTITVVKIIPYTSADTSICIGDTTQLIASGGTSYVWSPVTGLSSPYSATTKAKPTGDQQYLVTIGLGDCFIVDTVNIRLKPTPSVNLGNDTVICSYEPYTFSPTVSGADQYQWQPATKLNNAGILTPTTTSVSGTQTYILTVTNSTTGCSKSDQKKITNQKPTAQFTLENESSPMPPLVISTHNSSYPLPLSYTWEILDSTPSYHSSVEPTDTITSVGKYTIRLTVTDPQGCTDTMSTVVSINEESQVFIPNGFTPNGDGHNDFFTIRYTPGTLLGLKGSIWNRWGAMVYEFDSLTDKGWNGKVENQDAACDVYFYIIETLDMNLKSQKFHGTVTLLK